jgi:glycosyltransferase involved in cell wall biosynthesis
LHRQSGWRRQSVVIADCFSTDATLAIASVHGVRVIQREWVNHATQFNWALTQLDTGTDWVLRIDADEVLTPELAAEINARLPALARRWTACIAAGA